MDFKKIINILAWVALPLIILGRLFSSCLGFHCPELYLSFLIPLGLLLILINCLIKKDYQVSFFISFMLVTTLLESLSLYREFIR